MSQSLLPLHKTNLAINFKQHSLLGMAQNNELLIEGTYFYFEKNVNYSQENFQLSISPDHQEYYLKSEILSRVETGEFLKIIVQHEYNNHFSPSLITVEKSIGNQSVSETFKIDITNQELFYSFKTATQSNEFNRPINAKHYLASPAFAGSTIFTLTKKFDSLGRTPVTLISSSNEWAYTNAPSEKIIYAEFKSLELENYKINNNELKASHLCLYEHDSTQATVEKPVNIFISKHYGIPYELTHNDKKVVIKNLKKHV